MVEEARSDEGHSHVVLVAGSDNTVVTYATAGLGYIFHAALFGTLDIVAEGEEGVRTEGHAAMACNPFFLFFATERFGTFGEELLPNAFGEHVVVVFRDIDINRIIAIRTAYAFHPGEIHYFRMLAQPPDIRFVAGETGAVDAALLSGTDTDSLAVLGVAYGVALRIFKRNECNFQVALRFFGERLVNGRNIFKEAIVGEVDFVSSLFESNSINLLALNSGGAVVRVHFKDDVRSFTLGTENLQSFFGIVRSDYAVTDFTLDKQGGRFIAGIGKSNKVSVGRHSVRAAARA